jgi:hypothetical protein
MGKITPPMHMFIRVPLILVIIASAAEACGPTLPADYFKNPGATLFVILFLIPFELLLIKFGCRLHWIDTLMNYIFVVVLAKVAGLFLTLGYILGDLKWERLSVAIGLNLHWVKINARRTQRC